MPNETPEDEEPVLEPFSAFLTTHNKGLLNLELTEKMAELVKAVTEHGKPGKLTLTLDVRPWVPNSGKVLDDVLIITDEITVKAPREARASSLWYPDEDGGVHRNPITPQLAGMRAIPGGKDAAANPDQGAVNE